MTTRQVAVRTRKHRAVTGPQIVQIAADAGLCVRSVERAYDAGEHVSEYTRDRVTRSARTLSLPEPG